MVQSTGRVAGSSSRPLRMTGEEEDVVRALLAALRRIRHGSVQLMVQDNRVVQIDTVEKTRLKADR
ncbi:MAG: YezD family protein [Ktedonobacterales bacterium]